MGASALLVGAGGATSDGATGFGAAPARRRVSASTAAPLPGWPTELLAPLPPRSPSYSKAGATRAVRRLGVATRPPGQSHELTGVPPVAAA